jgi:hypothetical protein
MNSKRTGTVNFDTAILVRPLLVDTTAGPEREVVLSMLGYVAKKFVLRRRCSEGQGVFMPVLPLFFLLVVYCDLGYWQFANNNRLFHYSILRDGVANIEE